MDVQVEPFIQTVNKHKVQVTRETLETLQVNVGKLCNQACLHCHVEAGPKRTEIMELKTVDRILELLDKTPTIKTVDITGGAPEMNPHFCYFVEGIRKRGVEVIDRCNLTVFYEKGFEDIPGFLREHRIQVVASLPCYSKENVEKQRGRGVFDKSIRALKTLNDLGYGKEGTGLVLHLVYNPTGPFLPPSQEKLQADYKNELKELFDIEFNNLFTITNIPIKRFLVDLERQGKHQEYMELLVNHFNPQAAEAVMCRNLLSISWDGQIYDCDFNQMLEIPVGWKTRTLWDVESLDELQKEPIAFKDHCYGCTAGAGSSCGGSLVGEGHA